ncbi:MAG: hypothetical protein RR821_07990, partial [Clostridia bacterium]
IERGIQDKTRIWNRAQHSGQSAAFGIERSIRDKAPHPQQTAAYIDMPPFSNFGYNPEICLKNPCNPHMKSV